MNEFEITSSSETLPPWPASSIVPIHVNDHTQSASNLLEGNLRKVNSRSAKFQRRCVSMENLLSYVPRTINPLRMSECVPSPASDSSYGSSCGSNSSSNSSSLPSCEISLLERLIRTHPIWFLPSLQRPGALHLLQGRDVGNFIVRSSTQPKTMAVSVKLPGNNVEHYLLKANDNRISLENSSHTFETVHELIAHYCSPSDEIPVCLRVPSGVAEATSRHQLRSLALLGQEFWSHCYASSGKELSSPSDVEVSKNFMSSGVGSQSSSSQNSLSDIHRKPCRPTTLEIGSFGQRNSSACTPPPVPPRWCKSAFLTPLSLPSSMQSTPSEVQSTFSEKTGRHGKKKKRNSSGGKASSLHYKDTNLFKGPVTSHYDKASDYEDIWSPKENQVSPPLSTFKPEVGLVEMVQNGKVEGDEVKEGRIGENCLSGGGSSSEKENRRNKALSSQTNVIATKYTTDSKENFLDGGSTQKICLNNNNDSMIATGGFGFNKSPGLYSEPIDSVPFHRMASSRSSEPNINRKHNLLSIARPPPLPGGDKLNGVGGDGAMSHTSKFELLKKRQDSHGGCATSQVNKNSFQRGNSMADVTGPERKSKLSSFAICGSMDNLCHPKKSSSKSSTRSTLSVELKNSKSNVSLKSSQKDQMKTSPPSKLSRKSERVGEIVSSHEFLDDVNSNQSWGVDGSWKFHKSEDPMTPAGQTVKFPVLNPSFNSSSLMSDEDEIVQNALRSDGMAPSSCINGSSGSSRSTNSRSHHEREFIGSCNLETPYRFSRYDNLDGGKRDDDQSEDDHLNDDDGEEKISSPWDSSKLEHLLKFVSSNEVDNLPPYGFEPTTQFDDCCQRKKTESNGRIVLPKSFLDERHRISRISGASVNVDGAAKCISSIIHKMACQSEGVFGPSVKSFITCTTSAKIKDPHKIMSNVRQFISGMKNYLVGVSPENKELTKEIKKQTELLSESEFLNIDVILEDVLGELIIKPLNSHIMKLIQSNALRRKVNLGCGVDLEGSIGRLKGDRSVEHQALQNKDFVEKVTKIYSQFEDHFSPVEKLNKWNEFLCEVQEEENYSSDTFLPLLSEVLRLVCSVDLPFHVEYTAGLLPHSLAEKNNYQLQLLHSAVAWEKRPKGKKSVSSVKVIVPNESNGTLIRKIVPVTESTTNKEVAKMVASKINVMNAESYVLVKVKNGEEKACPDSDLVIDSLDDSGSALACKRMEAKIGWPQRIS